MPLIGTARSIDTQFTSLTDLIALDSLHLLSGLGQQALALCLHILSIPNYSTFASNVKTDNEYLYLCFWTTFIVEISYSLLGTDARAPV